MLVKMFLVDALTEAPFGGESAAVVFLSQAGRGDLMQALAGSTGASTTIYLLPHGDHFVARWFSPAAELALGAHATLAAAHVIYECGLRPPDAPVNFHCPSGVLSATLMRPRPDSPVALSLPQRDFAPVPSAVTESILAALKLSGEDLLKIGKLPGGLLVAAFKDGVSLDAAAAPSFGAGGPLASYAGLLLSAPAAPELADYLTRSFGNPALGVGDAFGFCDAQSIFGPFWSARFGKSRLEVLHLSGRGAQMTVEKSAEGPLRVIGRAYTVLRADPVLKELLADDL